MVKSKKIYKNINIDPGHKESITKNDENVKLNKEMNKTQIMILIMFIFSFFLIFYFYRILFFSQ